MGFMDDYEPVEDRIRAFYEEHPSGRINTEMVWQGDGDYIFKAMVWRQSAVTVELPDATGYAHDDAATLPPNMKASALEVCETSAIGRALANLGYAPKGKRPSREEMSTSGAGSSGSAPAPDTSSGGGGAAATPEEFGEGSEGVPAAATTPDALAPTWERLVERAGAASKARERLNLVSGTRYTPRTVQGATELEISMALASFEDAEFADE